MPNILLALALIGLTVFLIRRFLRFQAKPERRLQRDAQRLCAQILKNLPKEQHAQARPVLNAAQEHIETLLRVKRSQNLLVGMTHTAQELTQHPPAFSEVRSSIQDLDQNIASHLARFLADLSRLAAVTGLTSEDPILELNALAHELEERRDALFELSRSLHEQHSPSLQTSEHTSPSPPKQSAEWKKGVLTHHPK